MRSGRRLGAGPLSRPRPCAPVNQRPRGPLGRSLPSAQPRAQLSPQRSWLLLRPETSQGRRAWEQVLRPLTAPGFQVRALQGSECWPGLSVRPAPFWLFPLKSWAIEAILGLPGAPHAPPLGFSQPPEPCRHPVQSRSADPHGAVAVLHAESSPDRPGKALSVWVGDCVTLWGSRGGAGLNQPISYPDAGSLLSPCLPSSVPHRPPLRGDG